MAKGDTLYEKIAKYILLLSSDKDGDVVAAARAIMRALASDKKDIHDLAKHISGPRPKLERDETSGNYPSWKAKARYCERCQQYLRDKEFAFVTDVARLPRQMLTQRQKDWLNAIYEKVKAKEARYGKSSGA